MPAEAKTIELPSGRVEALIGGDGPALVVLPHEFGWLGWEPLHEILAKRRRVIAISPPGFDQSERPAWLRNVPDLAALVGQALDTLGIGRATVLGLGFGGWVAAELAVRGPQRVDGLLLHAPMGIKPTSGEILDQFLVSSATYVELGFTSAEAFAACVPGGTEAHLDRWENNREMTTRIAWKPYMYNPALPHLLRGLHLPAVVTWGKADRIVPESCARAYAGALDGAVHRQLDAAGHAADLEIPAVLAEALLDHLDAPEARHRARLAG
ncbi:MAG TPA: alpha/beta fold hydrolase [Stellaceae bacterium]|nr:alpha/beta fold hydrolase [Stellaceae bacterium]